MEHSGVSTPITKEELPSVRRGQGHNHLSEGSSSELSQTNGNSGSPTCDVEFQ